MLEITVPKTELWDEVNNCFVYSKETTLQLEHSLISVSKWESKWHKPYFSEGVERTTEEALDYIRCMVISKPPDDMVFRCLTRDNLQAINDYISDEHTATTFGEIKTRGPRNREIPTSELIYYWMIAHNIPFECQKWHINRLLTLIRICNIKSGPQDKMKPGDVMRQNAALNAQRRAAMKSKG